VATDRRFRMLNVNDRERQKSGHLISSRHHVVSLTVNGLNEEDVEENIEQEKNAHVISNAFPTFLVPLPFQGIFFLVPLSLFIFSIHSD